MTLENYVKSLNELLKNNPQLKNAVVLYSIDDEGNGFSEVSYEPAKGLYEDDEFTYEGNFEEEGITESFINAVCIN